MRQRDAGGDAHDAGGALDRVGRAHAGLELIGRRRVALEREEARGQRLRLRFRLETEQVHHRGVAQIGVADDRLRLRAWHSNWSSSTPTDFSRQGSTARVYVE